MKKITIMLIIAIFTLTSCNKEGKEISNNVENKKETVSVDVKSEEKVENSTWNVEEVVTNTWNAEVLEINTWSENLIEEKKEVSNWYKLEYENYNIYYWKVWKNLVINYNWKIFKDIAKLEDEPILLDNWKIILLCKDILGNYNIILDWEVIYKWTLNWLKINKTNNGSSFEINWSLYNMKEDLLKELKTINEFEYNSKLLNQ